MLPTIYRNSFILIRKNYSQIRQIPLLPMRYFPMSNAQFQSSIPMNVMNSSKNGQNFENRRPPQPMPIFKNIQFKNMPRIPLSSMRYSPMTNFQFPPSQNAKNVEIPKSPQSATIPPILQLKNMPRIQIKLPQRNNFKMAPPLKNDCRIPRPPIKYYRKSSLRTKQPSIRRHKFKSIPSKDLKTENRNLASNGNPAVLFYAPGKLKLVRPVPRLTDEKGVIIKMLYVHLTDTDAQMLASAQNSPYKLSRPTIAGRSGTAIIVDAGKQVENVKIGDTVSVKRISCGKCSACKNDNEAMCKCIPNSESFGKLRKFHVHPAKFLTKLHKKINPIDGAMIDQLSTAIRACRKSAVTAGDNVLVLDGGSLGLWTSLVAKSMGATNICLADPRNSVLEQAGKLGIDRLFLMNRNAPTSNTSTSISDYMEGDNPRVVFDCNGSSLTNQIAINTAKIGGKVVLMNNVGLNQPIVLSDAINREIDLLVSQYENDDSERAALQYLVSGKVQLNGINSCFFDLSNVHEAFRLLNSGTTSNIFIQLNDDSNPKKESKTS